MDHRVGTAYLLHPVGRADLGVASKDDSRAEELLSRLTGSADVSESRRILRLEQPEQTAGEVAPLAAVLSAVSEDKGFDSYEFRLVLMVTALVKDIALAIERALGIDPGLYGRRFERVHIVESPSLDEVDVAQSVGKELASLRESSGDRVLVQWGSGATQLVLGALDAVLDTGVPWSLVKVHPRRTARSMVFDPTADLPVDPLVPLLRRWRYHDLLRQLMVRDEIVASDALRRVIEAEADQWGKAYAEPTAARLRVVMAAALMRGDGSGGFAVRAYIEKWYEELREQDGSQVESLLRWAGTKVGDRAPLGARLKVIRNEHDGAIDLSKASASGTWLMSEAVCQLNDLGTRSSHELKPPCAKLLRTLREHLVECGGMSRSDLATAEEYDSAGLSDLSLVPAQTVWYVSILGKSRPEDPLFEVEHIAAAATSSNRCSQLALDPAVRTYLGNPDLEDMRFGLLIFGTQSGTSDDAKGIAGQLNCAKLSAVSEMIPDGVESGDGLPGSDFDVRTATAMLRAHLGDDVGAIVLVPTGPKPHVLSLLAAGQRVAAERGIPLFLRQLVTRSRSVVGAGTHRIPLRFGTDLGILSAALHALDIVELNTAARLLDTIPIGQSIAARVKALSYALRCATDDQSGWPGEVTAGRSDEELTHGLIAERLEVWANLPGLATDGAVQSHAIVGACAAFDSSVERDERVARRQQMSLNLLFDVRNRLPVTHGSAPLVDGTLDALVRDRSRGVYASTVELLAAMVERARARFGTPGDSQPRLVQLLDAVRDDVRQLRDDERARRARSRSAAT